VFPGLYYDLLKLDVFFSLFREEQCVAHHEKEVQEHSWRYCFLVLWRLL